MVMFVPFGPRYHENMKSRVLKMGNNQVRTMGGARDVYGTAGQEVGPALRLIFKTGRGIAWL